MIDKKKYLDALIYFENILNYNVKYDYEKISLLNKIRKLSLKEILYFIYQTDNSFFNDDKILILLFDDLALINGYSFKELPQRKSIIREYFRIKEKIKNNESLEKIDISLTLQGK